MEQEMNQNPANGERTFTQEEVNRIVSERLNKEKTRGDAAFAEREQQFAERERQLANREALADLRDQLKERGLPDALLSVLNVTDKGALKTALDALDDHINRKAHSEHTERVYEENRLPRGDGDYENNYELRRAMGLT